MTSLYICYLSIHEPLTRTQVISYLEGLALAGHRIILLTFESQRSLAEGESRIRQELARRGIDWYTLRYHKRPTVPATAFDIIAGSLYALLLARRHKVRLIHARSHVSGMIALALKATLGARFLFDIRGLLAEEYVDAGVWNANGVLFSLTKTVERYLLRFADSVVVLTDRGRVLLQDWYARELAGKPLTVVPCCVDLRRAESQHSEGSHSAITIGYVGKVGGWYATSEMIRFISVARNVVPGLQLNIWTQSNPDLVKRQISHEHINEITTIGRLKPDEVVPYLSQTCDAALSFIKPCLSKQASSPTKVGEYLAAGLPVITNTGIGDLDKIIAAEGVGVAVPEFSDGAYRVAAQQLVSLLADGTVRRRCIAAARKYFDLEQIGWARYRTIYERLAGA